LRTLAQISFYTADQLHFRFGCSSWFRRRSETFCCHYVCRQRREVCVLGKSLWQPLSNIIHLSAATAAR